MRLICDFFPQISPSSVENDSCQLMSRKKRRGVIEKKRRDRINSSLSELKRLVPSAFEKQGSAKLEKAEILQLTVDHLKTLHSKGKPRTLTFHFLKCIRKKKKPKMCSRNYNSTTCTSAFLLKRYPKSHSQECASNNIPSPPSRSLYTALLLLVKAAAAKFS
jgi:hypothetical protein